MRRSESDRGGRCRRASGGWSTSKIPRRSSVLQGQSGVTTGVVGMGGGDVFAEYYCVGGLVGVIPRGM